MKRVRRILIANATGPTNIGDWAMLESLLILIRASHKGVNITIHSSEHRKYKKSMAHRLDHTLYSWAVFSDTNPLVRMLKLLDLFIKYCFLRLKINFRFGYRKSSDLISDYKNADLILLVGGGYLRSQQGATQVLNALMQLLMIEFAKVTKKPIIVAPISFGPYAQKWIERISALSLKGVALVATREKLSFMKLKKYNVKNLMLSTDHALLLGKRGLSKKRNAHPVVGFTIRKWFQEDEQARFEKSYTEGLIKFAKKYDVKLLPIVQVDAPQYGDHDYTITSNIVRVLQRKKVNVLPVKKPTSLIDALKTYASLDMIVGMRMHSNILSATQHVPFVAISYEYKTEGVSEALGMKEYVIACQKVNRNNLFRLMERLHIYKKEAKERLSQKLEMLQQGEKTRWKRALVEYAYM